MPRTPTEIRCSLLGLQGRWPGSSCSSLVLSSSLQSPCKALTSERPSKAPPLRTRSSLTEILSLCLSSKPTEPAIPLHLSTSSHLTGRSAIHPYSLAEKNLFLPTCQGDPSLCCAGLNSCFHWEIEFLNKSTRKSLSFALCETLLLRS